MNPSQFALILGGGWTTFAAVFFFWRAIAASQRARKDRARGNGITDGEFFAIFSFPLIGFAFLLLAYTCAYYYGAV